MLQGAGGGASCFARRKTPLESALRGVRGTDATEISKIFKNLLKKIANTALFFAYISKTTNRALIFRAFARKNKSLENFQKLRTFLMKIQQINGFFKLFLENVIRKKAFGNKIIFESNFLFGREFPLCRHYTHGLNPPEARDFCQK